MHNGYVTIASSLLFLQFREFDLEMFARNELREHTRVHNSRSYEKTETYTGSVRIAQKKTKYNGSEKF